MIISRQQVKSWKLSKSQKILVFFFHQAKLSSWTHFTGDWLSESKQITNKETQLSQLLKYPIWIYTNFSRLWIIIDQNTRRDDISIRFLNFSFSGDMVSAAGGNYTQLSISGKFT